MTKKVKDMTEAEKANRRKNHSVHISKELHARMMRHYVETGEFMSVIATKSICEYLDRYEAERAEPAVENFNG